MYNERELANAVIHARRMVYCAQMKNRNLKKEEQLQKRYAKQEEAEEQKQRREVKRKVQQKQHVLEQKTFKPRYRLPPLQRLCQKLPPALQGKTDQGSQPLFPSC